MAGLGSYVAYLLMTILFVIKYLSIKSISFTIIFLPFFNLVLQPSPEIVQPICYTIFFAFLFLNLQSRAQNTGVEHIAAGSAGLQ
jgi:hypothetical protein